MNLNKYHSSGRLYTGIEARDRAIKLLLPGSYVAKGYKRDGTKEHYVKPYRNEAKHTARASRAAIRAILARGVLR